ncbi:MAG: pirin family protein [Vulcanimicrobiaceae bacterium]
METTTSPKSIFAVQRAGQRFTADHGWLRTFHSFSFADYYDPTNLSWGALRVLNDDYIAAGTGFPTHPHRDMEILTYVLSGKLEHRDSMGNHGVVGPGGVQFMSAGTGVRHSEVNGSKTDELHLVQMWVMPGKLGVTPDYGQRDFSLEERRNRWLDVASGRPGVAAPIALTQDAHFRVARLDDASLHHAFAAKRFGFLFVADGEITANGEKLHAGDAVRIYDVADLALQGSGEVLLWDVANHPE